MVVRYAMDCGGCGQKIPVGIGKVEYKFYTCPICKVDNYPGSIVDEFEQEDCDRRPTTQLFHKTYQVKGLE